MSELFGFIGMLIRLAIILAIVVGIIAVWGYNSLRKLAENVKEAESNIDIAVRKKISLFNQLLDVASKYMDRESLVMLKVSQDASSAATQQMFQPGAVLSTIQGMTQKFPDLKSDAQFNNLSQAIMQSESEVQQYRLRCNATIKEYNSRRSALPHALYASFLGFRRADYLDVEAVESNDVKVQKQVLMDDGERLNEILGMAGSRVLGATKTFAEQSRVLAEKAAVRVQAEIAARSTPKPGAESTELEQRK